MGSLCSGGCSDGGKGLAVDKGGGVVDKVGFLFVRGLATGLLPLLWLPVGVASCDDSVGLLMTSSYSFSESSPWMLWGRGFCNSPVDASLLNEGLSPRCGTGES